MRYYLDTEFIDTGEAIDLISLGIVAEDGREYYAQSVEFDDLSANAWVKAQVFPHLSLCPEMPQKGDGARSVLAIQMADHGGWGPYFKARRHLSKEAALHCPWRTPQQIKTELAAFFDTEQHGTPELWGWCAGYDWVALCQLFGTMMDLPAGWPHYIRDIQYLLDVRGIPDSELPPVEGTPHNALADAKQIKAIWEMLQR